MQMARHLPRLRLLISPFLNPFSLISISDVVVAPKPFLNEDLRMTLQIKGGNKVSCQRRFTTWLKHTIVITKNKMKGRPRPTSAKANELFKQTTMAIKSRLVMNKITQNHQLLKWPGRKQGLKFFKGLLIAAL